MKILQLLDVIILVRMRLKKGSKSNSAWDIPPVVVKTSMPRILSKIVCSFWKWLRTYTKSSYFMNAIF